MSTQGLKLRKSLLRLIGAAAIVIGMSLTSSIDDSGPGHTPIEFEDVEAKATIRSEDAAEGTESNACGYPSMVDIFNEVESHPLVHQNAAANRYRGVHIDAEPAWIYEVATAPGAGVVWIILALDTEYDGRRPPKRMVWCAVGRGEYPRLEDARIGQRLWVSGQIREIRSGQIHLEFVSLAIPQEQGNAENEAADQEAERGEKSSY